MHVVSIVTLDYCQCHVYWADKQIARLNACTKGLNACNICKVLSFTVLFRTCQFMFFYSCPILQKLSSFFRAWETYLVVLVLYTAWVSPFEFGFLRKPQQPLSIIDNVVNGFFAIDIILTFFLAYLDRSTYLLVDDRKKIAWRYTSTWLVFDVISTIPSELVRKIFSGTFQSYGLFNMCRLWRLRRVSSLFARYIIFNLKFFGSSLPSQRLLSLILLYNFEC